MVVLVLVLVLKACSTVVLTSFLDVQWFQVIVLDWNHRPHFHDTLGIRFVIFVCDIFAFLLLVLIAAS